MFIDSYDLIGYYDVLCLILAFILYFFLNLSDIISVFRWTKEQITMGKLHDKIVQKGISQQILIFGHCEIQFHQSVIDVDA
jgi:hypothetical protein